MQGDLNRWRRSLRCLRRASVLVLACALLTLSGMAAQAGEVVCKLTPGVAKFYIAPEVTVRFDEFGSARVADAIIAGTGRKAVFGSVSTNTAKLLRITWEVSEVKVDPNEYRFRDADLFVRLSITRAGGAAQLTVLDKSSRRHSYRAVGKCVITD